MLVCELWIIFWAGVTKTTGLPKKPHHNKLQKIQIPFPFRSNLSVGLRLNIPIQLVQVKLDVGHHSGGSTMESFDATD